jgi:hypothetical protein
LKVELCQEIAQTKADLRQEISETKVELKEEIGRLRTDMRTGFAESESRLTRRLIRWMFVFWTGTAVALIGAVIAIAKL